MIDLSKSKSWHLHVLQLFNGWYNDAVWMSCQNMLTTCSYVGLVFKSLATLVMLSVACFTVAPSVTMHVVLTGMLYTGDLIATSNMASALLVQHFGEQFGIVGAFYVLLGGFSIFLRL